MTPSAGGDDDTKSLAARIQTSTMVMHRDQVLNPSLPKQTHAAHLPLAYYRYTLENKQEFEFDPSDRGKDIK
jgi:hypothetical protein